MSKGTVLYFGGFSLPDQNAAAHRVIGISKSFKDLGYDVKLFGHSQVNHDNTFNFDGFQCYNSIYPSSIKAWLKWLFSGKDIINIIKNEVNLKYVILYNFPAFATLSIIKYCREKRVKVFGDITEWYSAKDSGILRAPLKLLDTSFRMHYVNRRLDGLIVISSYLEAIYSEKKVVIIPPTVDIDDHKWKKHDASNDVLKFIYAGSPGSKDGLTDIVASFPKNSGTELHIVGITVDGLNLEADVKATVGANHSIIFHGRLSHTEALELVKKSHYMFFYRQKNRVTDAGFPTKFVEATTLGIPVITSLSSDLDKYLSNKVNGYVVSSDSDLGKTISTAIDEGLVGFRKLSEAIDVTTFDYRNFTHLVAELIANE